MSFDIAGCGSGRFAIAQVTASTCRLLIEWSMRSFNQTFFEQMWPDELGKRGHGLLMDLEQAGDSLPVLCLFGQFGEHDIGIQMELVHQKLIGRLHNDIPGRHSRLRKVLDVEGDDGLGAGAHRGGQDMPVLVVIGHRRHQLFVPLDPTNPRSGP